MTAAERLREQHRRKNGFGKIDHGPRDNWLTGKDAQRLLAQIPADTRNLTQRLLNDPIFERSALFLKQQEAGK